KTLPKKFTPRSSGWGKVARTAEGKVVHIGLEELQGEMRGKLITAEEALRRRGLSPAERADCPGQSQGAHHHASGRPGDETAAATAAGVRVQAAAETGRWAA